MINLEQLDPSILDEEILDFACLGCLGCDFDKFIPTKYYKNADLIALSEIFNLLFL